MCRSVVVCTVCVARVASAIALRDDAAVPRAPKRLAQVCACVNVELCVQYVWCEWPR